MKKGVDPHTRVIVSLDGEDLENADTIMQQLTGRVWGCKLHTLVDCHGPKAISRLKPYGKVFLDYKLTDIPETIAKRVACFKDAGADFLTVCPNGNYSGSAMLNAAVEAAREMKIIAVSVLTSQTDDDVHNTFGTCASGRISQVASWAVSAKAYGITIPVPELNPLMHGQYKGLKWVTPGIRLDSSRRNDSHQRTATPREAVRAGAGYLVIGRPITNTPDPSRALDAILENIASA